MTVATRIGNDLAFTMTLWAGLLHREETLLHTHLTNTITGATGLGAGTWLGTGTITGFTFNLCWNTNFFTDTAYGLL